MNLCSGGINRRLMSFWILMFSASISFGEYIDGINWADKVVDHTDLIQKYGGGSCSGPGPALLDPNTPASTWLLLGESDSDTNGNMYAWDDCDNDYVAGWRGGAANAKDREITLWFEHPLENFVDQDDLLIRVFCGPYAKASVFVSSDGVDFVEIGQIAGVPDGVPGTVGQFCDASFDFGDLTGIHYVKVHRINCWAQTGMFFDSFSSTVRITPDTADQVQVYGWALSGDVNKDCYVDMADFVSLTSHWGKFNDPADPASFDDPDFVQFENPLQVPSTCHGVWQSGLGLASDLNHDCQVDESDLFIFAENWLLTNNPLEQENTCYFQNW